MSSGLCVLWACWHGISQADGSSFLDYEWIQIINLVTAWCLCNPMQKRLYCAFWRNNFPPSWLALLCCLLPVDSEIPGASGSPPPDAKGNFCLATVNDASVLGCVALVPPKVTWRSLCAVILLPPSPGVKPAMLQSDCAALPALFFQPPGQLKREILTRTPSAPLLSSAALVGIPNVTTTHLWLRMPASLLPFRHYDGGEGSGHLMDSWGYQKFLCISKAAVHFPLLLLWCMCSFKAVGKKLSSGRCLTSGKLSTVLFLCCVTRSTSLNAFLMKRRIYKGR